MTYKFPYKECQCVIEDISEELLITSYSDHRFLRSGALNYQKNRSYNWERSAIFDFVAGFGQLLEMGP